MKICYGTAPETVEMDARNVNLFSFYVVSRQFDNVMDGQIPSRGLHTFTMKRYIVDRERLNGQFEDNVSSL